MRYFWCIQTVEQTVADDNDGDDAMEDIEGIEGAIEENEVAVARIR